jgi:hypothetical protein
MREGRAEVIALVHQHQRPLQKIEVAGRTVEAVVVEQSDIDLAARLIASVTPGIDDLPIQTRRLLASIDDYVQGQAHELEVHRDHVRFSRRQLREQLAIGNSQLKVHLRRLVDAELVVAHATARGRGVVYSLAIDGVGDRYDDIRPGPGWGVAGPRPGPGRGAAGPAVSPKSPVVSGQSMADGRRQTEKRTSGSKKRTDTRNVPAPKEAG